MSIMMMLQMIMIVTTIVMMIIISEHKLSLKTSVICVWINAITNKLVSLLMKLVLKKEIHKYSSIYTISLQFDMRYILSIQVSK